MATAQETLHSLGHLPWVQEAWEGKKETEEMVSAPEEGPTLSRNSWMGAHGRKRKQDREGLSAPTRMLL